MSLITSEKIGQFNGRKIDLLLEDAGSICADSVILFIQSFVLYKVGHVEYSIY